MGWYDQTWCSTGRLVGRSLVGGTAKADKLGRGRELPYFNSWTIGTLGRLPGSGSVG